MPAKLSNLSERLNGTRQTSKQSRSRTPSVPEIHPELLAHNNANIHLRDKVSDEVLPLTEDTAFARCYYIDGFVNGRSKRPWEARIKLLFPQNPTWRSTAPADPQQTGLPTDQYGDMAEDCHWRFPAWGCTSASRDRFAALAAAAPDGPSPERVPALARSQTALPTSSATWSSPGSTESTACTPPQPPKTPRRNTPTTPKPRAFNQIKPTNIHLAHVPNDPTGCACELCLHRAGLDSDDLGPLDVVTPSGTVAPVPRPEPIPIPAPAPQPPSRASTAPASSDDGSLACSASSSTGSPRRRGGGGLRGFVGGGLRGARRGVQGAFMSKRGSVGEGLAARMKRSDSGYGSLPGGATAAPAAAVVH